MLLTRNLLPSHPTLATIAYMKCLAAIACVLLLPLAGCSVVTNMTTAKAEFEVSVKNESKDPIRIGLTKNGPPYEDDWATPESVAMSNPRGSDVTWGQLVLPGQTATLPPITGHFSDHVNGFVRVYAGDPQLADMLAMGLHSPNRLDLRLAEGPNRFVIIDDGDRLAAKRLPPEPTPAPVAKK